MGQFFTFLEQSANSEVQICFRLKGALSVPRNSLGLVWTSVSFLMQPSRKTVRPPPLRKRSISATRLQQEVRVDNRSDETLCSPREEDKFALFDTSSVVCLEIEVSRNGRQVPLFLYVPETSQMAVSKLEDILRDQVRYVQMS